MHSYLVVGGAHLAGLDIASSPGGHLVPHLAAVHEQTTAAPHILIGAWVLMGVGLLLVVVGELGRRGRLPRNSFVGIRLFSTMRDDLSWQRAHRAAGRLIILSGLPLLAVGAIGLAAPRSISPVLILGSVALMLVIIGVATWRAARATREP
jgi:uncharacterized membrane protein